MARDGRPRPPDAEQAYLRSGRHDHRHPGKFKASGTCRSGIPQFPKTLALADRRRSTSRGASRWHTAMRRAPSRLETAVCVHFTGATPRLHVKDAEFRPNGRQGVYSGYQPGINRAGRFRSLGDGQVDFKAIFSKMAQYGYDGWAVLEVGVLLEASRAGGRGGRAVHSRSHHQGDGEGVRRLRRRGFGCGAIEADAGNLIAACSSPPVSPGWRVHFHLRPRMKVAKAKGLNTI